MFLLVAFHIIISYKECFHYFYEYKTCFEAIYVIVFVFLTAVQNILCNSLSDNCNSMFQVVYSNEDRKFNIDITVGLIRKELLNLAEYNMHMAKLIDAGRNSMH